MPWTSTTTTVNVDWLVPSAVTELGLATNVVVVLDGTPGLKVTVVFNVAPSTVAVTVLTAACVELRVVVNTPALLVVPDTGVKVLLPPVALMFTDAFTTGWLDPLTTVTAIVEVALPSATSALGLAAMVDRVVLTTGAINVTLALAVTAPATKALTVSVCCVVEDSVLVKMPALLVLPLVGKKVLLVPLAESVTG